MPFLVFLLVLFLKPAILSLIHGDQYWDAWNGAWLDAFLVGTVVAVAQVVGGAARCSR